MADEMKRATGLLVIEVVNSNPNGDPDREAETKWLWGDFPGIFQTQGERFVR